MKTPQVSKSLLAILLTYFLTSECHSGVPFLGAPRSGSGSKVVPSPPQLLLPEDNASIVGRPVFSWSAVEGASGYSIQVAEDIGFLKLTMDQNGWTSTSVPLPGSWKEDFVYRWRVRCESPDGPGDWSSIRTYSTKQELPNAMAMIAPLNEDSMESQWVTFSWHSSNLAESYLLDLFELTVPCDSGGDCRDIRTGKDTVITVGPLRKGVKYGWWVFGERPGTGWRTGEERSFTIRGLRDPIAVRSIGTATLDAARIENGVLKYRLTKVEKVCIRMFNLHGRLLAMLVNQLQNAGHYSIQLPADARVSGIHVVDFRAGTRTLRFSLISSLIQ